MERGNLTWGNYLQYGEKRSYNENTTLFHQGEKGDGFYYLDQGMVINKFLSTAGEERYVNHILPGMLFGEEGSTGDSYLYTAMTAEPSTVYFYSEQRFIELCKEYPDAALTFMSFQTYNFRKRIQLIKFLDSNIETQLIFYLSQFVNGTLEVPFNQTKIANDLVTSRVTINKILRKWKEKGLVKQTRQKIQILNRNEFFGILNEKSFSNSME